MITSTKETAINDLLFLQSVRENLWKFHPDNENKVSIEEAYSDVLKEIGEQEHLINTL